MVNQNTRKTHCLNGHPLSGDNLRVQKKGYRNCCKCQNFRNYEYKIRHNHPIDRYAKYRKLFEASKHQVLFGDNQRR